ncbi:helix-turn-helix transcriptional regulator [Paenibacillus methanolicus]|uniref:AraC-like DNA-binding protein n=1 Tax=Paenibacillus methanolicus TaxID=582686 RepID=A0A5S5CL94_9BACL|nr:helix-turn-helix domain-containing protein [Paenibacillus methanolicus]TYP79637.1 AraC-like DNA-binding protein [Paenibacillus methanolicus]
MKGLTIPLAQPVRFHAAGEFLSETEWKHMERAIGNYELIIGIEETAYIREEASTFDVGPGDLLLLWPGRTHGGYRLSRPGVKFWWIHFDAEEMETLSEERWKQEAEELLHRPQRAWASDRLFLPQFMRGMQAERVPILVKQLLHVANSNYMTKQAADYLLTSLLIEISEHALHRFESGAAKAERGNLQFATIAEWTRIHASSPLAASDIAERFNYNKDYLTRLFKKHTGEGPLAFIHKVRLGKAKELLTRTDQSIGEIARASGFQDEKYFMRLFRQYERMTPSQYRNAYHRTFLNNF